MTDQSKPLEFKNSDDCAEFQAQLPELFESGIKVSEHPHLQGCKNCTSLVRDLEYIAEQAKYLMDPVEPSDALWESIASKLELDAGSADTAAPIKAN